MTKDEAEFRRSRLLHYIAADTDGTFTEVTVYDAGGGRVRFGKRLTTYETVVLARGAAGEAEVGPLPPAKMRKCPHLKKVA